MTSTGGRAGFRGYVTSRGFGGYRIPVPLQSLALRTYCHQRGMLYILPVNENIFPHSYLVLEGIIRDLKPYDGIVMCSMHMLPKRRERRRNICESVIDQGTSLHLVFEEKVVRSVADIDDLELLIDLYQVTRKSGEDDSLEIDISGIE